jgi:uncharacterized protein YjbJ (UPF0337 family)
LPSSSAAIFQEPFAPNGYSILAARLDGRVAQSKGRQCYNRLQETPMNRQIIVGNWDIAKGKLKQEYATLTDNDLRYVEGQEDELIGRLEKKTGAARRELERFLRNESNYRQS